MMLNKNFDNLLDIGLSSFCLTKEANMQMSNWQICKMAKYAMGKWAMGKWANMQWAMSKMINGQNDNMQMAIDD